MLNSPFGRNQRRINLSKSSLALERKRDHTEVRVKEI
jgi:hypothetical protein